MACGHCRWSSVSLTAGLLAGAEPLDTPGALFAALEPLTARPEVDAGYQLNAEAVAAQASLAAKEAARRKKRGVAATAGAPPNPKTIEQIEEERSGKERELRTPMTRVAVAASATAPPGPSRPAPGVRSIEELLDMGAAGEASSLEQRLACPARQDVFVAELRPTRKQLITKRSRRCPDCKKNLVRPEVNPSIVTFKVKSVCIDLLPHIQVQVPQSGFDFSRPVPLPVMFINPMPSRVTLRLSPSPVIASSAAIELPSDPIPIADFDATLIADEPRDTRPASHPPWLLAESHNMVTVQVMVRAATGVDGPVCLGIRAEMDYEGEAAKMATMAFDFKLQIPHTPRLLVKNE